MRRSTSSFYTSLLLQSKVHQPSQQEPQPLPIFSVLFTLFLLHTPIARCLRCFTHVAFLLLFGVKVWVCLQSLFWNFHENFLTLLIWVGEVLNSILFSVEISLISTLETSKRNFFSLKMDEEKLSVGAVPLTQRCLSWSFACLKARIPYLKPKIPVRKERMYGLQCKLVRGPKCKIYL